MRVLIDATAIPANRGGVGRYLDALIAALPSAAPDVEWHVACQASDAAGFAHPGVTLHTVDLARRPLRLAWEQVGLPRLVRRVRPDVLHSPHYTIPVLTKTPVVVTLHDATFFTDPHWHTSVKGRFFRTATRLAARRAAALVVPSQSTADQIVALLDVDPARITVAPHGVDRTVFRPPSAAEVADLRARLRLPERYIGFLGTIEPRKNVPALIRGWISAASAINDPPALVLAGGMGWDATVDAAIAEVPNKLRLIRPGYLALDDLHTLLGGAEVVAYPSQGEGFGLPVLEAMACGATVLTTRSTSLPEVGGDAVAYTGTSAAEIGATLRALLDDPQQRAALGGAALQRAGQFTWTRTAELHLTAYTAAYKAALSKAGS